MTALAPCHGMHLPPCVQVLRTGQSDKDETKDELGSQAHCFQAGGMGAPAQEPAHSPPRAAEDHTEEPPRGTRRAREWKPLPVGRTAAGDRVGLAEPCS